MFEICPACGRYSDGMLVEKGKIRCSACGNAAPFVQRPLFFLTGASGVGKSTAARILFDTRKEYVTVECDILWRDFFNTPQDGYADFRDTWLRLAANVSQYGKSAVLCGCVTPEQIQARPRKRYFSELHFIGVVCSEEEMARRMAKRGFEPAHAAASGEFNRWMREEGPASGVETIDATRLTPEETARRIHALILSHLPQ